MYSFGFICGFKVGNLKTYQNLKRLNQFQRSQMLAMAIAIGVLCRASQHDEGPSPQGMHIGLDEIHCPHETQLLGCQFFPGKRRRLAEVKTAAGR